MPAATEDLKDMNRVDAMMKFAFEASRSVLLRYRVEALLVERLSVFNYRSPFALNCHLYGLRRHKMDTVDNAVLGINAKYDSFYYSRQHLFAWMQEISLVNHYKRSRLPEKKRPTKKADLQRD